MSYADTLLSTGERVMHREKQHWFVFVWGARYTILAVVVGIGLAIFGNGLSSPARDALNVIAIVLFVGGVALLFWTTLRYWNQEYVLTNRRVLQVEGVLNKRLADSSLEKINDAVLTQSVFGRMFGFGDLEVLTAAETGISRFRMLVNPIPFKKAMLDAKHEYELDVAGGYVGGPPLRSDPSRGPAQAPVAAMRSPEASTDAGGPEPAHPRGVDADGRASSVGEDTSAVATPVRAPGPMSPDELTRTLTTLAELRDRGVISPDEYDRKKTDLLSRL